MRALHTSLSLVPDNQHNIKKTYKAQTLTKDELEDVVVDIVLAGGGVASQLEGLAEVHGALLLVDLLEKCVSLHGR